MTPDWVTAFADTPRKRFLPSVMWPYDQASEEHVTVDRSADFESWNRYACSDMAIITQWDDGASTTPGTDMTSSSSVPSLVMSMLADLQVQPGHKVLEIGTGTGWNAALLAHRAGPGRVTTIEVDPTVAETARHALQQAGIAVTVIRGDGLHGYPAAAPYDRLIATCGLRTVPYAWVEQMRPDGVLLIPWGTQFTSTEATARLVVASDGSSASGPFTRRVTFMRARAQRLTVGDYDTYVTADAKEGAQKSHTALPHDEVFGTTLWDANQFALGLCVPAVIHTKGLVENGARPVWLLSLNDRSWACVLFRDNGARFTVYQYGHRRLWDEIEAAHTWWTEQGRPGFGNFGLTIDKAGQHVWLDAEDNVVSSRPLIAAHD
ncbi:MULTISPECIES: methyltransferase domain-containing protein [Streptomyces]|uniref:Protein-L-isoaspartate O-methyltransferase n=1 Tax=Streptomyces griseocarneus TaxID=51201 RepID=A0ABX7RRA3_9ACTN|nr:MULTISPECIES: methyltransferase domain-containing protein [Streptomyces]QSY49406.1 methyltransferase domain-containing protein [Streptomyces griseocarneus]